MEFVSEVQKLLGISLKGKPAMKLALVGIVFTAGLCACKSEADEQNQMDQNLIGEAEAVVRTNALDPDAVQFRNERVSLNAPEGKGVRKVVCGEYNGKNVYGAYTGFKPYRYDVLDNDASTLNGMEAEIC
jgi:hypothetical protein